jgi:Sulfotransferase family
VQNINQNNCKYVFVCGLPRSGTSPLGRNIARMEDEGAQLQNVYPTEDVCGGPGRFGFDRRSHLTEHSALLTPDNVTKLRASWHSYWDNRKTIFVEKTPANLLMTRFLQAAFPNSYFVVIKRHPVAIGIAAQKWKVNVTSLYNMFEHWLHCHGIFEEDKKYLKHLYELKYEDYVENPQKYHEEIAAFIGTRVPDPPANDTFRYVAQWRNPNGLCVPQRAIEPVSGAYSKKYFDRWTYLLKSSVFRGYYRYIMKKYELHFIHHGYSLAEGLDSSRKMYLEETKIPEWVGTFYCVTADAAAFMVRMRARLAGTVIKQLRAVLPEFVKARLRYVRGRLISSVLTLHLPGVSD